VSGRHFSGRPVGPGLHEAGCFYGGPRGESYWFAVDDCALAHDDGDLPPLIGTAQGARDAWEYMEAAGLMVTGEQ
jgi:hypothetical protein